MMHILVGLSQSSNVQSLCMHIWLLGAYAIARNFHSWIILLSGLASVLLQVARMIDCN